MSQWFHTGGISSQYLTPFSTRDSAPGWLQLKEFLWCCKLKVLMLNLLLASDAILVSISLYHHYQNVILITSQNTWKNCLWDWAKWLPYELGANLQVEVCWLLSGTTKKFWVPDHGSRTASMAKFRAFLRNPDLFRTIFLTFPDF